MLSSPCANYTLAVAERLGSLSKAICRVVVTSN
jgi:hypothetical protein